MYITRNNELKEIECIHPTISNCIFPASKSIHIYVHIKGEIKLLKNTLFQAQISKFSKITIHLKFVNYEL